MDISTMERSTEGANIGSLFQQIINDLKNTSPLWEDFITKATKLHACLRATISAIASYLEAFQKIADAATNSKGASKEIGTALTRVCLRHKAVETRLKTFTTAIMDCLILPLQDKIEDWKKQVAFIDKEHAKEHKRCRSELKKRSTDTLRLQKKAKKGSHQSSHLQDNLQSLVDSSMQDVNARRAELDDVERKSLRTVMIEERMRYCTFVYMLQPVVKEECEVMYELGHLQEVMQNIGNVTKDPHTLPQASEELILESKTALYPDSPGGSNSQACSNSLGSRKSSVCSISSMNSNSSGSPGHQFQRSLSQYSPAIRLKPGESKDSGFCSSPALALQATTVSSQSHAVSTWPPPSQDPSNDSRPHTISTAYEKGHQRPPLTVYTFQSPDSSEASTVKGQERAQTRPPLPVRCSSLERPLSTAGLRSTSTPQRQCPSPIPSHITKEKANLFENLEKQQQKKEQKVQAVVRGESIYGRRDDSYNKSTSTSERDSESNVDPIDKDTIEELNNLIGELDLFQKEHEAMEKKLNEKLGYTMNSGSSMNDNHSDTSNCSSSDRNEKLSDISDTLLSTYLIGGGIGTIHNTPELHNGGTQNGCYNNGTTRTEGGTVSSTNGTSATAHKYMDYTNNEVLSYIPDDATAEFSGYVNPSFMHLNDTQIVVLRENAFPNEVDAYNHNHTEIITLKRTSRNTSTQRLDEIERADSPTVQRFSSFRTETPPTLFSSQNNSFSSFGSNDSASNQSSISASTHTNYPTTTGRLRHSNSLLEDRLKNKPAANPRPASLSAANVTRIARRASVNTVKPPPPVRRSSSVTPAHNLGNQSPANSTQNLIMTSSSESLPPPPAYLLDTGNQLVPGNVAGTVKALNEIKHTPASPGVVRRSQPPQYPADVQPLSHRPNQSNNASYAYHHAPPPVEPRKASSQGIYAKPQIPQPATSSFKQQTSQAPQKPQGILSQIASRINPSKHQQQQQQQQQAANDYHHAYYAAESARNEPIYTPQRTNDNSRFGYDHQHQNNHPIYQSAASVRQQQQLQQQQSGNAGDDYLSEHRSIPNAGSVISKTSAGFLENLNQKLAEQRLSGKAYAVRSYINSRTLPTLENNFTCVPIEYECGNPTTTATTTTMPVKQNLNSPPPPLNHASTHLANNSLSNANNSCNSSNNSSQSQNYANQVNRTCNNMQNHVVANQSQPDPRVCHESLMDQIKRGATLKRNRTVNDRSAPKIH